MREPGDDQESSSEDENEDEDQNPVDHDAIVLDETKPSTAKLRNMNKTTRTSQNSSRVVQEISPTGRLINEVFTKYA